MTANIVNLKNQFNILRKLESYKRERLYLYGDKVFPFKTVNITVLDDWNPYPKD